MKLNLFTTRVKTSAIIFGLPAAVLAGSLILSGCMTSKQTTVTPGYTNSVGNYVIPVTNVTTVVNQSNLALDCAALKLVGVPAVTYALTKDPNTRPILVDIQMALQGALHGTDTNITATITGFIGRDQALDDQLTPLINAASQLRGQLLAKYGQNCSVQISTAILQADLDIVTGALAAVPAK